MSHRSEVSPSTLPVEIDTEGVTVEYLDGRRVHYAPPDSREGTVRCQPGKDVHLLVTGPDSTEGVIVYINDRKTHDDILESTGVGRLLLGTDETSEVFPGVQAQMDGHAIIVDANPEIVGGRVFVFEEDEFGEQAYEIVTA